MQSQVSPSENVDIDSIIIKKSDTIEFYESSLDQDRSVYMITWSPDPSELPDCSFQQQHMWLAQTIVEYLKCCYTGVMCVESTQKGSPHYHGWYQIHNEYDFQFELSRIAMIKTMQRFGLVKISPIKNSFRINSYSQQSNALYYYKKDMVGSMLYVPYNPITSDTLIPIEQQNDIQIFFNLSGRSTSSDILEAKKKFTSARDFYTYKK